MLTPPTGADLSVYMGRSDPGDFDALVRQAITKVDAHIDWADEQAADWQEMYVEAVLAEAAYQVETRGYRGGVQMTDFGPIFARRRTTALERLLSVAGTGGFA